MCTIAAIKNASSNNRLFFKNVDQTFVCKYPEAFIEKGATYRYLKIPSNTDPATPGVLAGVNEAGVVVLGADGNCMPNYEGNGYGSLNDSLLIYEHILGHCGNIWEAMGCIIQEYQRRHTGGNGDIIILGDRKDAVALEYTPDRWGIEFQGRKPYLVRSNFFVLLDHLRPAPEENTLHTSSAIRYTDALKHLSIKGSQNTLDDVFSLVRSHYPGKNAMSICRHGGAGEYFTHASFVVELKPEGIDAHVLMNGKPCEGEYRRFTF